MLLEINKQLLRNDLRSKLRLESIRQLQKIDFIDWIFNIINGQTQKKDQQVEQINKKEREQRRNFMKQNFDNLVKKRQLIELLFYVWVQNTKNLENQSEQKVNDKSQSSEKQLNFALQAKNLLIDIIRYNPRLNRELYHIIESNSELGQTHLKPSYYTFLYQLVIEIDKNTDNYTQDSRKQTGKCWQFFIDMLTFWWSVSKDYLITTKYCYLRYNLLAFFIQKTEKQKFMSFQDGALIARISSGIQKRLIQPKYHKAAILIWTKFTKLLDLESQINIQQKPSYFYIDQFTLPITQTNKFLHEITLPRQSNIQNGNGSYQTSIENDNNLKNQQKYEKENLSSDNEVDYQQQNQFTQIKIKAPKTLQDCILALQNPLRRNIGLKALKKLIKKQEEDLIFVWKSLIKCLLHPLKQQSGQILKDLFVRRPTQWIQDVSQMFFKKDLGMNDKVILIECIETGINQLSQNPIKNLEEPQDKGDFYFKRVTSKYFTQKPVIDSKPQPQSRRWGHTRIAYQQNKNKKSQTVKSLLIVGNDDPYLNRLYPIITQLFFKIIIKLVPESQKSYLTNPLLSQRIMNLLGTVSHNIKNYFEKYLILQEILLIVEKVLSYIQSESQKQKKSIPIMSSQLSWNSKSVSSIVISSIQVLNKVALCLDKYLPEMMLMNLKECVQKLKKIDIYGIRPLVEMLEANIFNKIH